ncbi:MAG: transcription termination/antitermination NusG family protein [Sedimentisphaerales bacterium]|jgi:transcription antitermination factor NusG
MWEPDFFQVHYRERSARGPNPMLKLSENPSILSPEFGSVTELTGTWWIARTKAKFEKTFAWDMHHRGVGYFLPMTEKVIFSGGRKRRLMAPLFPLYVFFCGTEHDRYTAMTTNRICQTIEVFDQKRLVEELYNIERAITQKAVIDEYPSLPVGRRCRVVSGPMAGIEGTITEKNNEKARMVLEVTILGQGTLVEVDADLLEAVE